jgi:hypothetical protein
VRVMVKISERKAGYRYGQSLLLRPVFPRDIPQL